MKHYTAIHVGTRWATKLTWGVMVEGVGRPGAELLCVGCTQGQAESLVAKLNGKPEGRRPIKIGAVAVAALLLLMVSGCAIAPLKGGHASTSGAIAQSVVQSDNPAQASRQNQETVRTKSYTVPTGSRLVETRVIQDTGGAPVTNSQVLLVSAPMAMTEHEETRATTELGAAQKDTARELSAKLARLKGIVWVGVVVFLFGLATMFYPPLKLIIGSVTTSVAITAGGVALIVLPSLIVGNELLILGGVGAAVGVWFFAHRHGQLRGLVDSVKANSENLLTTADRKTSQPPS